MIDWSDENSQQIIDLSKFQMNLFSLPKQSPLQIFNFTTIDKKNKPAGLKLTGNIGNAPDYPFSSLNFFERS